MLTYLKLSGIATGLLLNFSCAVLKDGLRRLVTIGRYALLSFSLPHRLCGQSFVGGRIIQTGGQSQAGVLDAYSDRLDLATAALNGVRFEPKSRPAAALAV